MTHVLLNGSEVELSDGDTVLTVARRAGLDIPTLCHDPRLKPVGACRSCLVEIEGRRRLSPACATTAERGMVIITDSERVSRHQKTLLALYLTDHRNEGGATNELEQMALCVGASTRWPKMESLRADRPADRNKFIEFIADKCILCARCTRYCDEVEAVSAITLTNRGSATTISTAAAVSLLDSTCEMCGGCIDVCPTGAMTEKLPRQSDSPSKHPLEPVRTTCNYCGVGCQMDLNIDSATNKIVTITSPPPGTTTNDGNLCVKGRFAYEFIQHDQRLTQPLIRGSDGHLHPSSWQDALQAAASGLAGVSDRHGGNALGFISSARCTVEENYLMQKLARAVFGTNNVHQCAAT